MSTASAWKSRGSFPFCVEQKTAAEIAAIDNGKVTGTLAEIMAYFWLLETVDFTLVGLTQTSYPFCEQAGALVNSDALSPGQRVCETAGGIGCKADLADGGFYSGSIPYIPWNDSTEPGYPVLQFKNIFYDTTNSQYVLVCEFYIQGSTQGICYSTRAASISTAMTGTAVVNTETVSIFGQTQTGYRFDDDVFHATRYAPLAMSVHSPAYYTIV